MLRVEGLGFGFRVAQTALANKLFLTQLGLKSDYSELVVSRE